MGTRAKKPPRYDRRFLLGALGNLERENRIGPQAALVFAEPGTPSDLPGLALTWLNRMVPMVFQGELPNFSPFDDLVITDKTPVEDQRHRIWRFAQETYQKLEAHNLVFGAREGQNVAVFQVVVSKSICRVRVNSAVQGVWIWALRPWPGEPDRHRADITLELPAQERPETTHVTVVNGRLDAEPARLVLWNLGSSVIRRADRAKLDTLLGNSILVPAARGRFRKLKDDGMDTEEIRSHLWEALKEGVHPQELGSNIVDRLESDFRRGLPSRRTPVEFIPLGEPEAPAIQEEYDPETVREREQVSVDAASIEGGDPEDHTGALEDLDPGTLEILHRNYVDEEPQASIAQELGLSQPTVSRKIKAARAALRRRLSSPRKNPE